LGSNSIHICRYKKDYNVSSKSIFENADSTINASSTRRKAAIQVEPCRKLAEEKAKRRRIRRQLLLSVSCWWAEVYTSSPSSLRPVSSITWLSLSK